MNCETLVETQANETADNFVSKEISHTIWSLLDKMLKLQRDVSLQNLSATKDVKICLAWKKMTSIPGEFGMNGLEGHSVCRVVHLILCG